MVIHDNYNRISPLTIDEVALIRCYNSSLGFIPEEGVVYCNSSFDTVTCWPVTRGGEDAVMPCPLELNGVTLQRGNATKHCYPNGTWAEKASYNSCLKNIMEESDVHSWLPSIIFYSGYTISTVALLLALFIFWYFNTLRCRRNIIHCHLMGTFVIKNLLWLLMSVAFLKFISIEFNGNDKAMPAPSSWTCRMMVTMYNYLQVASFFWMFVEGLYLHTMIVWAFSADNVRFYIYALLGWGLPVPIIAVWVIVKITKNNDSCWLPSEGGINNYDLIFIAPALLILLINILFLASIEIVLIMKLRSSSNLPSTNQEQRQYKRAVKGTVILFPLLGLIYVIFITPAGNHPIAQLVYTYTNAILQSLQGLLVAVFYCFLNTEVRHTIKKRFERWKERRLVSTTYSRGSRGPSIHKTEGHLLLKTDTQSTRESNKAKPRAVSNGSTVVTTIPDSESCCGKGKDVAL